MIAAVFAEWGKYARRILNGSKRYEYRKRLAIRKLDVIYIYETAPVSAVVGMVEVVDQGFSTEGELYERTFRDSGMDLDEWGDYCTFNDERPLAYYELANPVRFPKPIPLSYFGLKSAPQSYAYVPDELTCGQMQLGVMIP